MDIKLFGSHAYALASYPRSGTNYFERAWKQKTGRAITVFRQAKQIKSLSSVNGLEIVSTIKPPLQSIISRTMIYFHEDAKQPIEATVKQSVKDYEDIYISIISDSDHIIDISQFDKLDAIIDLITNKDNKKIDSEKINQELDSISRYSRTFVGHEEYDRISEIVLSYDLDRCKELYDQAYKLSKYNDML